MALVSDAGRDVGKMGNRVAEEVEDVLEPIVVFWGYSG